MQHSPGKYTCLVELVSLFQSKLDLNFNFEFKGKVFDVLTLLYDIYDMKP